MWIPVYQELTRHPKTKKLARLLKTSIQEATGYLIFLWVWAADYAKNGDLSKYDNFDIADGCGVPSSLEPDIFIDALIISRFLIKTDSQLLINDWAEYTGKNLLRAEEEALRKKEKRNKKKTSPGHPPDIPRTSSGHPPDIPQTSPGQLPDGGKLASVDKKRKDKIRKEEIKEENTKKTTHAGTGVRAHENRTLFLDSQNNKEDNEEKTKTSSQKSSLTVNSEIDICRAAKKSDIPFAAIVEIFNEKCKSLPNCLEIIKTRKSAIKARWKEKKSRQNLEFWNDYFEAAEVSDWLSGRNPISDWKASFDWLLKPSNMAKVLEGNYKNDKKLTKSVKVEEENVYTRAGKKDPDDILREFFGETFDFDEGAEAEKTVDALNFEVREDTDNEEQ